MVSRDTADFLTLRRVLLKLDTLSNALVNKMFSEADAGVVGIDSMKSHKADVTRFCG